jgi:hypothetical protein
MSKPNISRKSQRDSNGRLHGFCRSVITDVAWVSSLQLWQKGESNCFHISYMHFIHGTKEGEEIKERYYYYNG